jgi:hypothetical protein
MTRTFFFSMLSLCFTPTLGNADEADDTVEKLAKKHGFLAERAGLDRTKPIARFGIQTTINARQVADVQMMMKLLPNLSGLKEASFTNSKFKDSLLKTVGECKQLEYLDLGGTLITDQGLADLSGLDKLRSVSLEATPVTDAGLKAIGQMKSLEILKISRTKINGSGFQDLAEMKKLKMIEATECKLTDDCLTYLADIKPLEMLIPSGTKFSPAALSELRKKKPKLVIRGYPR